MKTALITGASSGIGLEFAKVFASKKNNLVLVARNEEKLKGLANELIAAHGVSVKVIPSDHSKMEEVQKVYDTCTKENIQVEYLVNNAGLGYGFFAESDWSTEKMIGLNVKSLNK